MYSSTPILAFHFHPAETSKEAQLLTASLSRWCTRLSQTTKWVFLQSDCFSSNNIDHLPSDFSIFTKEIPSEINRFPFAAKILLAAEAEAHAESVNASELIWLDPDTIFTHEPDELTLQSDELIATTPVQLRNISSLITEPMDAYWRFVYSHCGVPEANIFQVLSTIDMQNIRAHFNAGLISVNPRLEILTQWKENFLSLYRDPRLEKFYLQDIRYKIFIHQAVLSATILSMCRLEEIKFLPKTYNFPLHLVDRMKAQDRPGSMEELTTVRYDDFDLPGWSTSLPSNEPLRSWLLETIRSISGE